MKLKVCSSCLHGGTSVGLHFSRLRVLPFLKYEMYGNFVGTLRELAIGWVLLERVSVEERNSAVDV